MVAGSVGAAAAMGLVIAAGTAAAGLPASAGHSLSSTLPLPAVVSGTGITATAVSAGKNAAVPSGRSACTSAAGLSATSTSSGVVVAPPLSSKKAAAGCHARFHNEWETPAGIRWENMASSGTTRPKAASRQVRIFMAVGLGLGGSGEEGRRSAAAEQHPPAARPLGLPRLAHSPPLPSSACSMTTVLSGSVPTALAKCGIPAE